MEDVLEVYTRPYDPRRSQVCIDEASKQLVAEVQTPLPLEPGQPERVDYEYERRGTANLFMVFEPLAGRRRVTVTERRTAIDFANVIRDLVDKDYADAEKIVSFRQAGISPTRPRVRYQHGAPGAGLGA